MLSLKHTRMKRVNEVFSNYQAEYQDGVFYYLNVEL